MVIVGNALVSEDIFERKFACQIGKCKGICCVEGDVGAPLENVEITEIESQLPGIRPFMSPEGLDLLDHGGFHETDEDGEPVTRCQESGECVFVVYTAQGVASCAIEQAHAQSQSSFRKPISCHLYPIRAKKYGAYTAMNYHNWDICSDACQAGTEGNIAVHEFLKDALIRKMGPEWYQELCEVYAAWKPRF
ncbi:MAG: DUF3109 family protein [Bacteroidia bacterium]